MDNNTKARKLKELSGLKSKRDRLVNKAEQDIQNANNKIQELQIELGIEQENYKFDKLNEHRITNDAREVEMVDINSHRVALH